MEIMRNSLITFVYILNVVASCCGFIMLYQQMRDNFYSKVTAHKIQHIFELTKFNLKKKFFGLHLKLPQI